MNSMIGIEELSEWFGVNHMTVRRMILRGDCPPYIKIGKVYRFEVREVKNWLYHRQTVPVSFAPHMRKPAGRPAKFSEATR